MRFVVGGIMHETHTFSVEPTTIETLDIYRGEELLRFAGTNHSVGGAIDQCCSMGIEPLPAYFAVGVSTGTSSRATFDALTAELCDRVKLLLPADGIVLNLHGAMVAEDFPDAEAEIARRIREVVGPTIPVAVTLDFHANIGQKMIDQTSIVTTYDTYPHTDAGERAGEAVTLLKQIVEGAIDPVMVLVKPPLLPVPQAMFTSSEPFRPVFERVHQAEQSGEALSVTVAGGFPYADVPDAGVSVLVTTDGDFAAASDLANELAAQLWDAREQFIVANVPPSVAVAEAIASPEWPVVLVDVGDNIGGGTPGDGTVLLAELLKQGAMDATVFIADAEAAAAACVAGPGTTLDLTIGGKTDRLHGDPVRVTGYIRSISDGRWVHDGPENAGVPVEMGPTAVLRVDGVNLVLTTRKTMPGDLQQLRSVGIEPLSQRILVVKAAVRWRGGYAPVTRHSILVNTPGLGSADLGNFDFQNILRPIYPLDRDAAWGP
ncbi:M81 family metallopeptidase [soil metagenome]